LTGTWEVGEGDQDLLRWRSACQYWWSDLDFQPTVCSACPRISHWAQQYNACQHKGRTCQ